MANFLGLVNSLPGLPGNELHDSERGGLFAHQGGFASAHHEHSLPSFPEAFGAPGNWHQQPGLPPFFGPCPLYGDLLQQQYRRAVPPLRPCSPANVPRGFDGTASGLAPLHQHIGRNSNDGDSPRCPAGYRAALQWTESASADRPFACLSRTPPYTQHLEEQQQQQPLLPLDNHINPHPLNASLDLDLESDWDLNLHHTHYNHGRQPPAISQAPPSRVALFPTTTAPSTARADYEHPPFSIQPPPFFAHEQPPPQPDPSGDSLLTTTLHQASGADFDHLSSPPLPPPNGSAYRPFSSWHRSMTSAPDPDLFEPDTAMPSITTAAAPRRRSSRRLSSSIVDLTKEESRDNLASSSPVPMAPPTTRKRRRSTTASALGGTSTSTARRTSVSQPSKAIKTEAKRPSSRDDNAGVFGSSPPPAPHSDDDVLDLTEANEASADQKKTEMDRRVKLSRFQCVICMDDVSNLTVTHCGHLFCSECLHSALHIDSSKKSCPVCRTKVDIRSKTGKNTKSYYHLELKVMTATRKGKQPAAASR